LLPLRFDTSPHHDFSTPHTGEKDPNPQARVRPNRAGMVITLDFRAAASDTASMSASTDRSSIINE
ncbi:MAG: hypothetical protein WBV36_10985, partial [Terriglobales bacterium]